MSYDTMIPLQITAERRRAYDKARGKMLLSEWILSMADEAAKKPPRVRSFCPYCGRLVLLNKDGGVRCHDLIEAIGDGMKTCPGRYSPPVKDPRHSILGKEP